MDYITIQEQAQAEFTERKSRFVGQIKPVSTEAQAIAFIDQIAKQNRSANHNVFAYVLRNEGSTPLTRCSDAGEPQGTAGVPCLDVLQKEGITDVCVVVTRYFGGILLGTGGLVRAYSHAAKIALDAAAKKNMATCYEVIVECAYAWFDQIKHLLPNYTVVVEDTQFTSLVSLYLLVHHQSLQPLIGAITDLTNGQVLPVVVEERFADISP